MDALKKRRTVSLVEIMIKEFQKHYMYDTFVNTLPSHPCGSSETVAEEIVSNYVYNFCFKRPFFGDLMFY